MAVPAWEMASNAYSTWYRRPSGEKMVVCALGKLHRPPCLPSYARSVDVGDGAATDLLGNRIVSTCCRLDKRGTMLKGSRGRGKDPTLGDFVCR
jgi:hypothetical protein